MMVNQASCLSPKGSLRTRYLTYSRARPRPAQSKQHSFWLSFYTVPLMTLQPPSVLELETPRALSRGRMVDRECDYNLRVHIIPKNISLVLAQEQIYVTEHKLSREGTGCIHKSLKSSAGSWGNTPLCFFSCPAGSILRQ